MFSPLLKTGVWIAVGVLAGRAAGLLRESSLAATYGAGEHADLAVLTLTVPDLLVNIIAGGALSAAFIPEVKRLGRGDSECLFVQTSVLTGVIFLLFATALVVQAEHLVRLLAPGFDGEMVQRAAEPIRIALWVIPLTMLTALTAAYLQAHDRFVVPAFSTFIFNLTIVVGLLFFVSESGTLKLLAAFVVAAGLVRWLSQLTRLPRLTISIRWISQSFISSRLLTRYFQALSAGSLLLLLPLLARAFASFGESGNLATFNYAVKLVELPLAVSIMVVPILLFPRLAESFVGSRFPRQGEEMLEQGMGMVLILSLAMMISMIWFSGELSRIAFGWGTMPDSAVEQVAAVVGIGLLSLPAQGVSGLLVATLNAKGDTAAPLFANGVAVVCFSVSAWVARDRWGLQGLMGALAATHYLVMIMNMSVLRVRHLYLGRADTVESLHRKDGVRDPHCVYPNRGAVSQPGPVGLAQRVHSADWLPRPGKHGSAVNAAVPRPLIQFP